MASGSKHTTNHRFKNYQVLQQLPSSHLDWELMEYCPLVAAAQVQSNRLSSQFYSTQNVDIVFLNTCVQPQLYLSN